MRLEIEAALTRNVLVIPILVDGASMPDADELPPSLARLVRRHALELSPDRFDFDSSRLLKVLDKTLAEVAVPFGALLTVPGSATRTDTARSPSRRTTRACATASHSWPPPATHRRCGRAESATASQRPPPRQQLRAWGWSGRSRSRHVLVAVLIIAIVLRPQPSVAVPEPGGASVDDVMALLQQAGLVAESRGTNEKVAPGKLLRMAPPAGTKLQRGAQVTLFVSSGPKVTPLPADTASSWSATQPASPAPRTTPTASWKDSSRSCSPTRPGQLQGLDSTSPTPWEQARCRVHVPGSGHHTHCSVTYRTGTPTSPCRCCGTARRQQAVDFVDYLTTGTALLVPNGNPPAIRSLDDLCGRTIVRPIEMPPVRSSTTATAAGERDQRRIVLMTCPTVPDTQNPERKSVELADCPAERRPAAAPSRPPGPAAMVDAPLFEQAMKRTPAIRKQFEIAPVKINGGRYGIAVDKDDRQVRDALQSALRALMADGTYKRILAKWNLQSLALRTATVTAGPDRAGGHGRAEGCSDPGTRQRRRTPQGRLPRAQTLENQSRAVPLAVSKSFT